MTPEQVDRMVEGVLAQIRAEQLENPARVERTARLRAVYEAFARRGLTPTSFRPSTMELTFPIEVVEHILAALGGAKMCAEEG